MLRPLRRLSASWMLTLNPCHSSPQHSNKHALDLRHLRCSFGIRRSVEIIGDTNPPFEDIKKLSLGQPGVRHGDGLPFHKL